jgi:hypothetical protein
MRWRISDWRRAADRLRDHHPAVVALLPDVREKLSGWEGPPRFEPPAMPQMSEPAELSWKHVPWIILLAAVGVGGLIKSLDHIGPKQPSTPVGNYTIKGDTVTLPNGQRVPLSELGEATQRLLGVPKEQVKSKWLTPSTGSPLPHPAGHMPSPPATTPSGKSP